MTLDQLTVIDAIVETGSFRGAAEKLRRAQSAVSYAVKHLEEELGFELFSRDGYRPTLTSAGGAYYERARGLLCHAREVTLLGKQLSQQKEPLLRVALSVAQPLDPLIPVLRRFNEEHPHTRLKFSTEVLGAVDHVMEGDADLALTEWMQPLSDHLEHVHLSSVGFLPVVSSRVPLGQREGRIPVHELRNFIQIVQRSTSGPALSRSPSVLDVSMTWSVGDLESKKSLIRWGMGWGLLPSHEVASDLERGDLVVLQCDHFKELQMELYLVRKRDVPHGPAAQRLWELLLGK